MPTFHKLELTKQTQKNSYSYPCFPEKIREGGLKDINCSAQNAALFVDLL